jgi:hypothetical protein
MIKYWLLRIKIIDFFLGSEKGVVVRGYKNVNEATRFYK